MIHYFLALATTIVVEVLVLRELTQRPERKRVLTACVFVNCLTHPIAWILNTDGLPLLAIVELAVVVAEARLYSVVVPVRFGRALRWSLAANVPTMLLSFVL